MKIEIKNKITGSIIFSHSEENNTMAITIKAAIKSFANLRYADLSSANLRYADLSSADLSSANLRFANLRYANLRYANLRYANLRYANLSSANLSSADLRFADLSEIKMNWSSHSIISARLFSSSGQCANRRMLAGLISISLDWCWDKFISIKTSERDWAVSEMKKWITPDDGHPAILDLGAMAPGNETK